MWQLSVTILFLFSVTKAIPKHEYQYLEPIEHHKFGSADSFQYDLDKSEYLFGQFVAKYDKKYESEEYNKRLKIFRENLVKYNKLNENSKTARYGINHLADLDDNEAMQHISCLNLNGTTSIPVELYKPQGGAPDTWDWRTKNVVTPVKSQGKCGSCYIFSSIGNIEGQYAKNHNELNSFSEQQVLDCDKYDSGCGGGMMENVFHSIIDQHGVELESSYPYKAKVQECKTDQSKIVAKLSSYKVLNISSEEELKDAVYNIGPLSIALFFSNTLHSYTNGISDPNDCTKYANHALTLVGYGVENDTPYWLIKNSWGDQWGEKGYLRMIRGKNSCEILSYIVTSVVE